MMAARVGQSCLVLSMGLVFGLPLTTFGGEPAQEFISRLRDVGYHDTAIAFLDRVDKMPGLQPDFVTAVPLEKAQTYIDAATSTRSAKERDDYFVLAQNQLVEFLKKSDHPRMSEARLLLGKLQVVRAQQLISVPNPSDDARTAARESLVEATKTFDTIVTNLRAKLEELKGQRIDEAKEPAKAEQRKQYRYDFLQAQLRGAEARRLTAKTFARPSEEGKPLLEEALKAYIDLSDKYDNYVEGAMAMTYRGQVQVELGKSADAIDSFQRALENVDVDPLRETRMQAITGLIGLLIDASPPRFDEAIQLGQGFADSARPNEKRMQSLQDLQVALAGAYIANAAALKASGKKPAEEKRATTNARQLLIAVSKVTGSHETLAKELLAKLGIEQADAPKAAVVTVNVKSLEEALTAARDLFIASDELARMSELMKGQQQSGGDANAIAAEQASIAQQLDQNRSQIVELMRRGLSFGSKDNGLLNQARQYLAYAEYQRGYFYEAAVVGSFLARSAPNESMGLQCGLVALNSLQNLLRSATEDQTPGLVRQIQLVGAMLVRQWPDDPQAAAAKGIMIQIALDKDRWDEARKLLSEMPAGAEKAAFQRLMGQLLWNRTILLRQDKQNAEADALLPDASKELKAGLEGIPGNLAGPEALQAALILSKIELRRGDADSSLAVLDNAKYGPLTLIEKQGEPSDGFKSDLYAAELRAVVGKMTTDNSDVAGLLKRATDTMERLQSSVKGKDDASERLVRIYLDMARDIREQLDSASPEKKTKLINAFRVFLESIAKSTTDPATLEWVGKTLMQMGEASMAPGELKAQGQAKELLTAATATLSDLIAKQGAQATPVLKFQLAKAQRLNSEYKQAIDLLETVLMVTPMMIDAQVEAATVYEQWAGSLKPEYASRAYEAALQGAKPDKSSKNVIFGWGKISQLVSSKQEFRPLFFEARYHVALCRYLMGKVTKDNAVMERSSSDITQVAALYPDFGGPEKRLQFDLLMKEIQKSLGKKPDGLPPIDPGGVKVVN